MRVLGAYGGAAGYCTLVLAQGYFHSAASMNYIRSLIDTGFGDLRQVGVGGREGDCATLGYSRVLEGTLQTVFCRGNQRRPATEWAAPHRTVT